MKREMLDRASPCLFGTLVPPDTATRPPRQADVRSRLAAVGATAPLRRWMSLASLALARDGQTVACPRTYCRRPPCCPLRSRRLERGLAGARWRALGPSF